MSTKHLIDTSPITLLENASNLAKFRLIWEETTLGKCDGSSKCDKKSMCTIWRGRRYGGNTRDHKQTENQILGLAMRPCSSHRASDHRLLKKEAKHDASEQALMHESIIPFRLLVEESRKRTEMKRQTKPLNDEKASAPQQRPRPYYRPLPPVLCETCDQTFLNQEVLNKHQHTNFCQKCQTYVCNFDRHLAKSHVHEAPENQALLHDVPGHRAHRVQCSAVGCRSGYDHKQWNCSTCNVLLCLKTVKAHEQKCKPKAKVAYTLPDDIKITKSKEKAIPVDNGNNDDNYAWMTIKCPAHKHIAICNETIRVCGQCRRNKYIPYIK